MKTEPWPWPEDDRFGRAQRVARHYRHLVVEIAEGRASAASGLAVMDAFWQRLGVTWMIEGDPDPMRPDGEDWVSAADAAHYAQRTPKDIYNWARRGCIQQRTGPDGAPEYLWGSVDAHTVKVMKRRMGIRA